MATVRNGRAKRTSKTPVMVKGRLVLPTKAAWGVSTLDAQNLDNGVTYSINEWLVSWNTPRNREEAYMPNWLASLINSGTVWAALLALINIIIKATLPGLSVEIVTAVNVLVVAILAAVGINVNKAMRARGL
jgi:hypothetical protein